MVYVSTQIKIFKLMSTPIYGSRIFERVRTSKLIYALKGVVLTTSMVLDEIKDVLRSYVMDGKRKLKD